MSSAPDASPDLPEWLEIVRQKVAAIRFGSVQITVHEGRVTQVEAIEKTRITHGDTGLTAPRSGKRPLGSRL